MCLHKEFWMVLVAEFHYKHFLTKQGIKFTATSYQLSDIASTQIQHRSGVMCPLTKLYDICIHKCIIPEKACQYNG